MLAILHTAVSVAHALVSLVAVLSSIVVVIFYLLHIHDFFAIGDQADINLFKKHNVFYFWSIQKMFAN